MEIKVSGLKELDSALKRFPIELQRKELAKALRKAGQVMADDARDRAPVRAPEEGSFGKASGSNVRVPGFGKSTIKLRMRVVNGIPTALIGWSKAAFYLAFSEFGTSRQAARPFMRPAFDATAAEFLRDFAFHLRLGIERTAKKLYRKAS